jgi:putative transposase
MPRIARVVVPGLPHHVTQRGNGRQATFSSDDDRRVYLDMLRGNVRQFGLRIWAYCLMDNHIHLLAVPERPDSLARSLGRTHARYAQYWNARRARCGHVWQARYYSCPIEDAHLWTVARYVEMNPVRAGLAENADCWPWSSALAHLTGRDRSGLLDMTRWAADYDGLRWRGVLETSVNDEAWYQRRPFGSDTFIGGLEASLGCRLRPKRAGRRPRQATLRAAAGIGS